MNIIGASASGAKGAPSAPTIGTATAGNASASVTFTASSFSKLPITSYTVTASPGGATGTGASSPITVSGLTNGTAYTFTVTATNANGTSNASAASNSVTPASPVSYESIATASGNGVQTITFSSIPQTYKHLEIVAFMKSIDTYDNQIRFNGDTGTNYSCHRLFSGGSSLAVGGTATTGTINAFLRNGTGSHWGAGVVKINNYSTTTNYKSLQSFSGLESDGAITTLNCIASGNWRNTNAISSITIYNDGGVNWDTGTTFSLYGIKG